MPAINFPDSPTPGQVYTDAGISWVYAGSSIWDVVTGSYQGTFTGSLLGTASWAVNAVTASYVPASGVIGLNLSQISSGSVTASVNINSASFQIVSASSTFLFVSNSGRVNISSNSPSNAILTNLNIEDNSAYATGLIGISIKNPNAASQNASSGIFLQNSTSHGFLYKLGSGYAGGAGNNLVLYNYASGDLVLINENSAGKILMTTGAPSVTTTKATMFTNGNFSLQNGGTFTDAGFRLDVSGSARITNGLQVSGSLDVSGSARITQNLTASRAFISSSNGTASGSTLIVFGSGSAQPVFTVQGSQGELFSVNDSLSGSLFSVNDISGLPIIEAFSDNRILIGSYQAPALFTTVRTTSTQGSNTIYQNLPTASYDGAFFDYTLRSGSNARAGQITAIWSGSSVNYTETVTTDFGDTTGVRFAVIVTGSNMALTGSFPSASWTMKTIVRSI